MSRLSLDALNDLIAHNRRRLAALAGATENPLMPKVIGHLERSVTILERHRDELMARQSCDNANAKSTGCNK
jgi:hypothetical protein